MAGHACTPGCWRSYLLRAASAAWGRVRTQTWPILQSTGAATAAWAIAAHLIDHHEPFFAPVAAVVALNTSRGERGLNAVRLLLGVIVGIVVGSLALRVGGGYGTLAMATFTAMLIALALGGQRLVIAQAAVGAILTVTIGQDDVGLGRLIDALIGAGVALLISQVLLPAEPIALLRRAEATTLEEIGSGLELTADALDRGDENLAERAIDRLRDVRDQLADLARTRTSSRRAMWGSPLWWGRGAPVLRESENAGHLDLLGGSALMLARTAEETSPHHRAAMAPLVRELAAALTDLASAPGERDTRRRVAEQVLGVARRLPVAEALGQALPPTTLEITRIVAVDIMIFAGVEPDHATRAASGDTASLPVADPPATLLPRWWRGRSRPW